MTINSRGNLKIKFLLAGTIIVDLIFAFFFVFQYNTYMLANYEIGEHEKEVKDLSLTNEELGANFIEANHLENIDEIAQKFNFEKSDKIHYIKAITGEVAAKR